MQLAVSSSLTAVAVGAVAVALPVPGSGRRMRMRRRGQQQLQQTTSSSISNSVIMSCCLSICEALLVMIALASLPGAVVSLHLTLFGRMNCYIYIYIYIYIHIYNCYVYCCPKLDPVEHGQVERPKVGHQAVQAEAGPSTRVLAHRTFLSPDVA